MEVINFLENRIVSGGREAFVANASAGMKEAGVTYVVLANDRTENIYENQIRNNGAKVVYLRNRKRKSSYFIRFWNFARYARGHRNAVWWFHACATSMYHYVFLARICGVTKIAYHVHNISYTKPQSSAARLRDKLLNRIFRGIPNMRIACSEEAGRILYKNMDFIVVHNGIDVDRFRFHQEWRKRIREEWGVKDTFVIGQIGRFAFPKNQLFTLSVIKACKEKGISCVGILVGEGEDLEKMKKYILEYDLLDSVRIIQPSERVEYFYQGFDMLMFPSIVEGLGIVALEAQAAGLPILCSQAIVPEVCITDHIWRLDLGQADVWAEKIAELQNCRIDREEASQHAKELCTDAGFSISNTGKELLKLYERL